MNTTFLCESHKQQFQNHPALAEEQWQQWIKKGLHYYQEENYQQAIIYLGSSFDLASLLINLNYHISFSGLNHFDRLIIAGHSLAECYNKLQHKDLERHYLMATHHKLMYQYQQKAVLPSDIKKPIEISLFMLKRHFDFHQEYAQIQHCYEKDWQCLQKMQLICMH